MPRTFQYASVGASGTRRIVPIMGIDFIAGNIELKKAKHGPYGARTASIGGRTRHWSTINFVQVNRAGRGRTTAITAAEINRQQMFSTACKSAVATLMNAQVISVLNTQWMNGTVVYNTDPNKYATKRGWVTAIRFKQLENGESITPTTDTWPPSNPH